MKLPRRRRPETARSDEIYDFVRELFTWRSGERECVENDRG